MKAEKWLFNANGINKISFLLTITIDSRLHIHFLVLEEETFTILQYILYYNTLYLTVFDNFTKTLRQKVHTFQNIANIKCFLQKNVSLVD